MAPLTGTNGHGGLEAAVFEAMVAGWESHQRRRRLAGATICARLRVVRRFTEFCDQYPWRWEARDVDDWALSLRSGARPLARSTVVSYQQDLGMFCAYLLAGDANWSVVCEERFNVPLAYTCHRWNAIALAAYYQASPGNRPLTRYQVQVFFDHADEEAVRAGRAGHKGWLATRRDAALFKVMYAWGLRPAEAVALDVGDFGPGPSHPHTVMAWGEQVVAEYLSDVRPHYRNVAHPAMWLTEQGRRLSTGHVDERFRAYRRAVGFEPRLGPLCLRQSHAVHVVEDGVVLHAGGEPIARWLE